MTSLESILAGNDFTGNYNYNPETDKAPWFNRPLYKNVVVQAGRTYNKLKFEGLSDEEKAKRITSLLNKIGSKLYGPLPGKIEPEIMRNEGGLTATYKIKKTSLTEGLLYPKYERTLTVKIANDGAISIRYEVPKVPKGLADKDAARLYSALRAKSWMFAEEPNGGEAEAEHEHAAPAQAPERNDGEGGEHQNGYEAWAQQGMQNNYVPRLLQAIRQVAQRQAAQMPAPTPTP